MLVPGRVERRVAAISTFLLPAGAAHYNPFMRGTGGDVRRMSPRVPAGAFCSEIVGDRLRHVHVVDVADGGLRIQRPLGGPRTRQLQLELEIPGVDEILWTTAQICFDEVWKVPADGFHPSGLLRTSGLRLVSSAARHQRLLREFVVETWREMRRAEQVHDYLLDASCYMRG